MAKKNNKAPGIANSKLDEIKAKKEQEAIEQETKLVAKKIEAILLEHNFGLSPFLVGPWNGAQQISAQVRLVKIPDEKETEDKN